MIQMKGSMHWKATIQNTIYHSQVNVELSLSMVSEVKVQEEPMAKMKVRAILCLYT